MCLYVYMYVLFDVNTINVNLELYPNPRIRSLLKVHFD